MTSIIKTSGISSENSIHYSRIASRKRNRKKRNKKNKSIHVKLEDVKLENIPDVEYTVEKIELEKWDPNYGHFSNIFEKYKTSELTDSSKTQQSSSKFDVGFSDIKPPTVPEDEDPNNEPEKLSKRKLKEKYRMSTAQLKQVVLRPEVVEMHDSNSKEPKLLIHLKSYRNLVPVPRHWCAKRKYLQGKRGFVKPPFELPDFIKATGIMEMRSAFHAKEDSQNLKAKMRSRIRPKLGKVDIDYQKLHDAFFKYQTKPKMSMHGDLYYEGKEFEVNLKLKKPGDISDDLRISLGMPVGMNKQLVPPPWLIAMQRYGPPPSYPNLRIPGLNAPIPDGATFGYHAGGWGKPPVDEMGRPLYGDVFGPNALNDPYIEEAEIDKTIWGELEEEVSEDEYDEEMEDLTNLNDNGDNNGLASSSTGGFVTPGGFVTTQNIIPSDFQTPDKLELRKQKEVPDKKKPETDSTLYSVIPEKKQGSTSGLVATSHTYDLDNAQNIEGEDDMCISPEGEDSSIKSSAASSQSYADSAHDSQRAMSETYSETGSASLTRNKKKKEESKSKKYKDFKF